MGSLLAAELNLPFVDADQEIESAAGCSVADIFETHGESAFRDLERKILARLLSEELKIIAPGGGAVMNDETAALVW
jgi:shikimate kinase